MKKNTKIIAFILAIVIVFSMGNVTVAAKSGEETKIDVKWTSKVVDVYLSHNNTLKLLDKLNVPTGTDLLKIFIDIVKGMVTGGTSWFETTILLFAGEINKDTVAEIKAADNGNGVIITFPFGPGLPRVRSQSVSTTPVVERAQISIIISPRVGGKTAGSGSYEIGKKGQIWAYPNSGWQFDGWYDGNVRVSQNTTWSFTVDKNRLFEARFKQVLSVGHTPSPSEPISTVTPTPSSTPNLSTSLVHIDGGLAYITVASGKSIEITNLSSTVWPTLTQNNEGIYDSVLYKKDGIAQASNDANKDNTGGGQGIPPGMRLVLSVGAGNSSVEFVIEAELIDKVLQVKEYSGKALHFFTVTSSKSVTISNNSTTVWPSIAQSKGNVYDAVLYNKSGGVASSNQDMNGGHGIPHEMRLVLSVKSGNESVEFFIAAELLGSVLIIN